jgi:tRNA (guanosine-2'-O-)-methyltransferase
MDLKTAGPDYPDKHKLLSYLTEFITAERKQKFLHAIALRTRYLTLVLEDIYQPHNASAVLRTCDCFGIQDVHIIENRNKYEVNPDVALGSAKWLSLFRYGGAASNTKECLLSLKDKGYTIVATSPHKDDHTPDDIPLDRKLALVFGTELMGLSDDALAMADSFIRIPMFGFTESLNVSVSAAIFIHSLAHRIRSSGIDWCLTEPEKTDVLLSWTLNSIRKPDILLRDYFKKNSS